MPTVKCCPTNNVAQRSIKHNPINYIRLGFALSAAVLLLVFNALLFILHDPLGSILDDAFRSKSIAYEYLADNSHEFMHITAMFSAIAVWSCLSRRGRRRCDAFAASVQYAQPGREVDPRVALIYDACGWYRMLRFRVLLSWLLVFSVILFAIPQSFYIRRAFPIYWLFVSMLAIAVYSYKGSRNKRRFVASPRCYRCDYAVPDIVQCPGSPTVNAPFVVCSECGATCPTVSVANGKLVPYWNVRTMV